MPTITVTKRLAARHEIDGAIYAIGLQRNYLAAEVLASAALDVIRGVGKANGKRTLSDDFDDIVKPEKKRELNDLLRKPYNFMKHSDRDAGTAIDTYEPDAAVWRTFWACVDYARTFSSGTMPMYLFQSWHCCRYPDIILEAAKLKLSAFQNLYSVAAGEGLGTAAGKLGRALINLDENRELLDSELERMGADYIER
jgi:hypothetical protein